ncbi:Nudix (Nucleoside diphosphate linked moiety X)-type motif 9 [Cichlidogyrus casuarinus]|uniref:Nudix (Nucleoside diphosphate linked moiety X)-type motif 9 n=1 Tax=Cichlidogyrus casuarinus TaxID=1844966 RepID=A0ABD2Q4S0_9PLAT
MLPACTLFVEQLLYPQSQFCRIMSVLIHIRARESPYGREKSIVRFPVPDEKVPWSLSWSEYKPPFFEMAKLASATYADPNILVNKDIALKFNQLDGELDRTSFHGLYQIGSDGLPLNPMGRTGLSGRGALGRWGPNHAADPIVTRWKRDTSGAKVVDGNSNKPILEMAAIMRGDTREWAIPGGMVDAGEDVSVTLKREFMEEALDSHNMNPDEKKQAQERQNQLFSNGIKVYAGYVDDPRNTDNAWMETVAMNFHDESGEGLGKVPLTGGDDAVAVKWTEINSNLKLYASHKNMIQLVAQRLNAHW